MIVGVPKEAFPGERRVALVPGALPPLTKASLDVLVETATRRRPVRTATADRTTPHSSLTTNRFPSPEVP